MGLSSGCSGCSGCLCFIYKEPFLELVYNSVYKLFYDSFRPLLPDTVSARQKDRLLRRFFHFSYFNFLLPHAHGMVN